MRWPGHKGVPGVAPERDQRPKDASPTSVTQRRGAGRYRTRSQSVKPIDPGGRFRGTVLA